MEVNTFVVVYLVEPKERFWGLLKSLSPAGITVRGLTLESFEGWARHVVRGEGAAMGPATIFFPLFRVQKMFEDESLGELRSYAEQFRALTGEDPRLHLTPIPDSLDEE
jgi:hypothetical protein